MTETNVHYHVEDGVDRPSIDVKVHAAGPDFWPDSFALFYARNGDHEPIGNDGATTGYIVEQAYNRVQSDFWQAASEIATQRGLGEIEQQGRSGGWLVFTDGRDPQDPVTFDTLLARDAVTEWLAGYRSMVEWAEAFIADAPRKVADLAQQYAMDEAGEPAARRMFAFGGIARTGVYEPGTMMLLFGHDNTGRATA